MEYGDYTRGLARVAHIRSGGYSGLGIKFFNVHFPNIKRSKLEKIWASQEGLDQRKVSQSIMALIKEVYEFCEHDPYRIADEINVRWKGFDGTTSHSIANYMRELGLKRKEEPRPAPDLNRIRNMKYFPGRRPAGRGFDSSGRKPGPINQFDEAAEAWKV